MSSHRPAWTKGSSQAARTRAPPRGSATSLSSESTSGDEEIPFSAVTSSTSRPRRSTAPATEARRSNVTFAGASAPSVAPSDSISRVKSSPAAGKARDRRSSRVSGKSGRSRASRDSSQVTTAWSGDGPLTATNLERLQVIDEDVRSQQGPNTWTSERPRSDEQEQARSTRRIVREYKYDVEDDDDGASRRSSRRNDYAQSNNYQSERVTTRNYSSAGTGQRTARNVDATTVDSGSSYRAKDRATTVSHNVIDIDTDKSRATGARSTRRSSRATTQATSTSTSSSTDSSHDEDVRSQSRSKAATQSRYRNDSASYEDIQTTESNRRESRAATKVAASGAAGASKSSVASESRQTTSTSTTATAKQDFTGGWERHTHITTKVYADGREIQEREVKLVRSAAAAA